MSSSSTTDEKMIVLKSSDGETFEVKESVAMQSQTIKHIIEDDCANTTIPLPVVTSNILSMIIDYCNGHVDRASSADDLEEFDKEFMKNIDMDTLYHLFVAANYLEIKSLLDLAAQTVADKIKGKTPEQIRDTFGIKNDFTPEEEKELREENAWAHEDL